MTPPTRARRPVSLSIALLRTALLCAVLLCTVFLPTMALDASPAGHGEPAEVSLTYALIDIDGIGHGALDTLKDTPGFRWWVEADDQLLVLTDASTLAALAPEPRTTRLDVPVAPESLHLVARGPRVELLEADVDILVHGGWHTVVQARHARPLDLHSHGEPIEGDASARARVQDFVPNTVLARQVANGPPSQSRGAGAPDLQALADSVDEARWYGAVEALAGFNRYTFSPEIHNARDWLVAQFEALPRMTVQTLPFQVQGVDAFNVIATLPGTVRPDEWYIIGAHYDARAQSNSHSLTASPGAEDNATGCAGVLEMARIFSAQSTEATVLFMCYSGEEQGLLGSDDHVDSLVASGDLAKVQAMLNMEMMGFSADSDLDILLGSRSQFPEMVDLFTAAAETYSTTRVVLSLTICCSDHVPYIDAGVPTVVVSGNDWFLYPHYHRSTDTPDPASVTQAGQILRLNVAAMAQLIGVEFGPIFVDGFESGDLGQWNDTVP